MHHPCATVHSNTTTMDNAHAKQIITMPSTNRKLNMQLQAELKKYSIIEVTRYEFSWNI